jgi:putative inorganic carbon (HCO3(-)) transporter
MEASLARGLRLAQKGALATGAFLLPLAVVWNASDTYVLPKLLLGRALVIVLAALWLARSALERRLVVQRTGFDLPLLAFVTSAVISTILAINGNVAFAGGYERYEGLLTILLYGAMFWLTVQSLGDSKTACLVIRSLLASAYVVAAFAIGQSLLASAHGVPSGESAFTFGGLARAQGTMGNPTLLATFLAMLLPVALGALLSADSWRERALLLNAMVVMSLALVLSFSRAGLLGALIGVLIVGASRLRNWKRSGLLIAGFASLIIVGALVVLPARGGLSLGQSVIDRIVSVTDPMAGSNATRLHVWEDTVRLIASRPLVGYGPDTFGLVYPAFESGNWTPGFRIDKAHADTLQVAATQGLFGLAAYVALLLAALSMFWRARREAGVVALFAGWVAYQVPTQVNFSWVPSALPYWLFLAAAAVVYRATSRTTVLPLPVPSRRFRVGLASLAGALAITLLIPAVGRPFQAEADFSAGLQAELEGNAANALENIHNARTLAAGNPVYAVEDGTLLLRKGDLDQARSAFKQAIDLGSQDPTPYRSLTMIDQLTGHREEAAWSDRLRLARFPFSGAPDG